MKSKKIQAREMRVREHHISEINRINFSAIALFLGVMLFLFVLSRFTYPQYTSFVKSEVSLVEVNEMMYKGSSISFGLEDNSWIALKSLKISGTILGQGSIEAYLVTEEGKLLVFSNRDSFEAPLITGFNTYEIKDIEYYLEDITELIEIETITDQKYKQLFEKDPKEVKMEIQGECVDTCLFESKLIQDRFLIEFEIEEGTAFYLSSIELY